MGRHGEASAYATLDCGQLIVPTRWRRQYRIHNDVTLIPCIPQVQWRHWCHCHNTPPCWRYA